MADEQVEGVETATAQASESETQTERQEAVQDDQQRKRNDAEYNWAETRRKLEEHERVIREQREIIDRMQKPPEQPEEDLSGLSKEDIITVGQHEKLSAKIVKKEVADIPVLIAIFIINTIEASIVKYAAGKIIVAKRIIVGIFPYPV